jgi:anti-sigma factor RsiW
VTHLGEQISALIDGELTGAELDRANAHLAACERCRAEAAEMRQLKRALRALFEVDANDQLTARLLSDAGPGGPVPSRQDRREQYRRSRGKGPRDKRPRGRGGRGDGDAPRSRARYVVWSAVSLFVVGIGAAAFSMGGGGSTAPAPKITPQLEMFSVEHAIVSGTVPEPEQTPAGASVTRP